ncbi:MAG: hypothetical protein DI537_10610 [Stutzerimonas stutzeri]|nr:MAG: hypothetical protein DI537_10610 [Stutzerimonas stutzeri]
MKGKPFHQVTDIDLQKAGLIDLRRNRTCVFDFVIGDEMEAERDARIDEMLKQEADAHETATTPKR